MKAVLFEKYDSIDHWKLIDKPIPEPNTKQVLIKVKNSSINAMESHLSTGMLLARPKMGLFKPKAKYNVLGADISGEIVSVGSEVKGFKKGDQVFGDIFTGGYAEYALAQIHQIALKPENVSHEQAAAIPVAGMTALKGIRDIAKVKKGDHVLINGASGGVGTYTVQIAKHYGAKVTTVCSGKNIETMKALGADEVIDYTQQDFTLGGIKYDHVIDIIGNKKPKAIKAILKPNGICAVIGFTKPSLLFRFMLSPSKQLKMVQIEASNKVLTDLGKLLSEGHIKSHITAIVQLEDVPQAVHKMRTRRTCGKQVVQIEAE